MMFQLTKESAVGFVLTLFTLAQANAAEISVIPSANGAPDRICVKGNIEPGDDQKFNQLVLTRRNAIVELESSGGKLVPSIQIGRTIRIKQFSTEFTGKQCNSGCALIWIAGQPRRMGKHSVLGFHVAYESMKDGTKVADPVSTAMVGAYLANLGLSDRAIFTLLDAGPDELSELTPQRAGELGIAVKIEDEPKVATEYYAKAVLASKKDDRESRKEALSNYVVAAQYGNSAAQDYLGNLYARGDHVAKNDKVAIYWFTRAAERGDPNAYLSLASAFAGSDDALVQVEALKFALLAQKALPVGAAKTKAEALIADLKSKLTQELIESAEDLVLVWEPVR